MQESYLNIILLLRNVFLFNPDKPFILHSIEFAIIFLIFLIIYRFTIHKNSLRIKILTVFSLYFYYRVGGAAIIVLLTISILSYVGGNIIALESKSRIKLFVLILFVIFSVGIMAVIKYVFPSLYSGKNLGLMSYFVPAGISFYTFQAISYVTDIYRKSINPVSKYSDYLFCLSFFPHTTAGPILRTSFIEPQIRKEYSLTDNDTGKAIFLILSGLIKKAVISDYIGMNFIDRVFEEPSRYTGLENILAVYGYTLQIYFDFSGYIDLASGLAILTGFRLPVNFNEPYKAYSITEFWKRWNITLSNWLRDYIFFPLTLKGKKFIGISKYASLIVTMLIAGAWHGSGTKFLIWGGLHGILMTAERITTLNKKSKRLFIRTIKALITFNTIAFMWIIFRADNFYSVEMMLHSIISNFHPNIFFEWINEYTLTAVLTALGYLFIFMPIRLKNLIIEIFINSSLIIKIAAIIITFLLINHIKTSQIQPYIYFNF